MAVEDDKKKSMFAKIFKKRKKMSRHKYFSLRSSNAKDDDGMLQDEDEQQEDTLPSASYQEDENDIVINTSVADTQNTKPSSSGRGNEKRKTTKSREKSFIVRANDCNSEGKDKCQYSLFFMAVSWFIRWTFDVFIIQEDGKCNKWQTRSWGKVERECDAFEPQFDCKLKMYPLLFLAIPPPKWWRTATCLNVMKSNDVDKVL